MGRHSASADDEDDAADAADSAVLVDDTAVTGRHLRIQDLPSASTQSIPIVDAEITADADAHIGPVYDTPAAEFEPILPGEAVIPPDTSAGAEGIDALEALLGPAEPRRPEPRDRGERPHPRKTNPPTSAASDGPPADAAAAAGDEHTAVVDASAAEPVVEVDTPAGDPRAKPRPVPRDSKAEKDAAREQARLARISAREAKAQARAGSKQAARAAKAATEAGGTQAATVAGGTEAGGTEAATVAVPAAVQAAVEPEVAVIEDSKPQAAPAQMSRAQAAPEPASTPPAAAVPTPAKASTPPAPGRTKHDHASAADLALLRSDHTLLARVLAGLLAPFVVYVIVMLLIGGHGVQWLLWIWIPTITGCVLAGSFLDIAHKQTARPPAPSS